MDTKLLQLVQTEANARGLSVAPSFSQEIDRYIQKHFSVASDNDRVVIETYLSNAAIRIASTDKKNILEAADAKAAVWLFHQPDQIDSTCAEAGNYALKQESGRKKPEIPGQITLGAVRKGLLNESFARHLDSRGDGYRRYL